MREPERDFGRLQDIIQAANHIASFTDGYSQEELKDDKLRFFAVVKNVEIIGEAAYMLSLVFKDSHSEILGTTSFACAIFWFTVTQQSFRNCSGKLH